MSSVVKLCALSVLLHAYTYGESGSIVHRTSAGDIIANDIVSFICLKVLLIYLFTSPALLFIQ